MEPPALGLTAFFCLFGAAVMGSLAHARMPQRLLGQGTLRLVQRSVGLVAIMSVLLLTLMTASLSSLFGSADRQAKRLASEVTELDRTLRRDGTDAAAARGLLFRYTARTVRDIWPDSQQQVGPEDTHAELLLTRLRETVDALPTGTEAQRQTAAESQRLLADAIRTRWAIDELTGGLISPPVVVIVMFGLVLSFAALGLWAPRTPVVIGTLFVCALALGGALFVVAEYDYPYTGIIIVSAEPLQSALFAMSE